MYLAYLDDSGTHDKSRKYQVLTAVLVHDQTYPSIELNVGQCVEDAVPPDKIEQFEEFHAWELYGGRGIFEGVPQDKRFHAIKRLLTIVSDYKLPVIYGAVDIMRLQQRVYASANPIDIAFRICATGLNRYVASRMSAEQQAISGSNVEFGLLLADDTTDKKIKFDLRNSFRQLRKQIRPPHWHPGELWFVHDDMYFGNSKDSIGIQLADLCSYFIGKHLEKDEAAEWAYQLISDQIVNSEVEPAP